MKNKQTVLSFYYKHKPGGFTTRLYKAWTGLANTDYQVIYISTENLPVEHPNIKPHIINCSSAQGSALFWLEYFLRAIFQARKLTQQHNVKCFLVFSFFYSALAVFSGLGKGIKTLVFIRGDDLYDATFKSHSRIRISIHNMLEKFSTQRVAMVIATNKHMMNMLKARNNSQAIFDYLPNDIVNAHVNYSDTKHSHKDGIFRFVTTSVLNKRKSLIYALEAMEKLKSSNWEYWIIGADVEHTGYGKEMEDFIQKHNLQNNVKMLGWKDNAAEIVSQCDLYILQTTSEGSPNALLEALGTNISCIGSDIPEVAEVLDYPELVYNLESPQSLSDSLDTFCTKQEYRDQLAELSLKCRERYVFNWEERIVDFVKGIDTNAHQKTTTKKVFN